MTTSLRPEPGPFHAVLVESDRRSSRLSPVRLLYGGSEGDGRGVGIPGAITAFVAHRGSEVLESVEAAVTRSDPDALKELVTRRTVEPAASAQLARQMIEADVFADVTYADKVISRGVFVPPGADLAVAVFPYNGGRIAEQRFALREYVRDGRDVHLDGVLVQASPSLTPAEQAALDQLPAGLDRQNIGVERWCDTTWWKIARTLVQCIGMACLQTPDDKHLTEEQLNRLSPSMSALELLAMRRELLGDDDQRRRTA